MLASEIPSILFLQLVGRLTLKAQGALLIGSFGERGSIRWMKDGLTNTLGINRNKQLAPGESAELEISHGPLMVPVVHILLGLRKDPTFLEILTRYDELYARCQDYKKNE